ncbi:hypothetical protein KN815_24990 [Streptomyces sp. 4503]|uniref:D-alanyl-D-alanine dipeptidase n=1 Tax=Streptomyces niphimycinicus TaxID=2842201 RepID=A0ABS6CJU7_9ACTN|nr:hypothetical protein [Streptomyces niphimycinicus]MBU3867193.1 hypothetical protein [Streptomyces niphimycinicus]
MTHASGRSRYATAANRWSTAGAGCAWTPGEPTRAGHFAHLQSGVVERLERAEKLLPDGWRWLLVEGYRPPAVQQEIFDGYAATLRRLDPDADEDRIRTEASRWCAPAETAGHVAGAGPGRRPHPPPPTAPSRSRTLIHMHVHQRRANNEMR